MPLEENMGKMKARNPLKLHLAKKFDQDTTLPREKEMEMTC